MFAFKIFTFNYFISKIVDINKLSYTFIIIMYIFTSLIIKYFPLYSNIRIGSGRSSSINKNIVLLILGIIVTLSPKGGALFFMYFALSDVFFSRSWVEYD